MTVRSSLRSDNYSLYARAFTVMYRFAQMVVHTVSDDRFAQMVILIVNVDRFAQLVIASLSW